MTYNVITGRNHAPVNPLKGNIMKNAIIIDAKTFEHSVNAELYNQALKADLDRLGDKATKTFRDSFMAGQIAVKLDRANPATVIDSAPATVLLSKAAPLPTTADADAKAKRREKIKSGEIVERTKVEQQIYSAAKAKLSYWLAKYNITPAQERKKDTEKAKRQAAIQKQQAALKSDRLALPPRDITPSANTATTADKFIRQQAAMLMAYSEKNKKLVSDAARDAIAELMEALRAIPETNED